ncbi:nucleotidyltransferase domain-containing protein [Dactylosporangium sp. NPDC005555]|uniref:nucleotidyltransferase domain-containing protein n=1 Tax=Dactylosporangium sp. NPDC005555 TaxID=3154889 RepID=UPI0033A32BF4
MPDHAVALAEFGAGLRALGWVSDLLVAGSLATGDYLPGVSDLDLVAVTDGPVGDARQAELTALHRRLDATTAAGLDLGCAYVCAATLGDAGALHPTWTHGQLVRRIVSGVTRAELVLHGYATFGRRPRELLPAMTGDDVRDAARAELVGYWTWAARRPWIFLDPMMADLGLTSMARGRYALRTGHLLTKSLAVEQAAAPGWLVGQLRARRRGEAVTSPRLRTAWIAWRDTRRTTRAAHRPPRWLTRFLSYPGVILAASG